MKSILIISSSYPVIGNGSEAAGVFVKSFAAEVSKECGVTVIAPGRQADVSFDGNIRTIMFGVPKIPLSTLSIKKPWHWFSILKTLISGARAVRAECEKNDYAHIFALWSLPCGYWAMRQKQISQTPYSTWALGSDIWSLRKIPVVKNILARVLINSSTRFADGFQLKNDVEDICGKECVFLPSSRDLKELQKKEPHKKPPYNIAYLGRWHPNKGIDLLLKSLLLLDDVVWNKINEVKICGGGPLEKAVLQMGQALIQKKRPVEIGGFLNEKEMVELFAWADFILIPSRIESIPVVFSDAMQMERPVITTPVGDLPYLIEKNKCGVVSEQVTSESFAIAISQALDSRPSDYKEGISKAKSQFSIKNTVQTFLMGIGLASK